MTVYYPAQALIPQFVNPDNGELAIGFTLESYLANSDIPTPLYIDKNGSEAGTVIPINSGGFPEVNGSVENIWLDASLDYKIILRDDRGIAKWTINDLSPRGSVGGVFAGIEFDQSIVNDAISSFSGILAQESIDRANAISAEAQARIDAINAAISEAEGNDAVLTQLIESLEIEADIQGNSIASLQETVSTVLVNTNDNSDSISSLTLRQSSSESAIENQELSIDSIINYTEATRSAIEDVYGDGSNVNLESFSQTTLEYASRITQAESTLGTAVTDITAVSSRVDDVENFSSSAGSRLSQIESDYAGVEADLSAVVSESASTQSRIDNLDGDGLTVETLASNVETVSSRASSALSTAQGAVSSVNSAQSEIDTLSGTVSAISSSLTEVAATAEDAENVANNVSSSVTQNSQAIATLNNGVGAQWEVKANVGDITGSVGLYNDNGVTKFAIDANAFEIWDTSTDATEAAFDFSGGTLSIRIPTTIADLQVQTINIANGAISVSDSAFIVTKDLETDPVANIFSQSEILPLSSGVGFNDSTIPTNTTVNIEYSIMFEYLYEFDVISSVDIGDYIYTDLFVELFDMDSGDIVVTRSYNINKMYRDETTPFALFKSASGTQALVDQYSIIVPSSNLAFKVRTVTTTGDDERRYRDHIIRSFRFNTKLTKK